MEMTVLVNVEYEKSQKVALNALRFRYSDGTNLKTYLATNSNGRRKKGADATIRPSPYACYITLHAIGSH